MAIKRDLSLTPRKEDLRDAKPITIPIQLAWSKLSSILKRV